MNRTRTITVGGLAAALVVLLVGAFLAGPAVATAATTDLWRVVAAIGTEYHDLVLRGIRAVMSMLTGEYHDL